MGVATTVPPLHGKARHDRGVRVPAHVAAGSAMTSISSAAADSRGQRREPKRSRGLSGEPGANRVAVLVEHRRGGVMGAFGFAGGVDVDDEALGTALVSVVHFGEVTDLTSGDAGVAEGFGIVVSERCFQECGGVGSVLDVFGVPGETGGVGVETEGAAERLSSS